MTTSPHLSAPRLGWTSLPDAPGSYTTQLGGNMIVLVVCSCAGGWQASVEAAEHIHLTTVFSSLSDAQAAAAALAAGLLNEVQADLSRLAGIQHHAHTTTATA